MKLLDEYFSKEEMNERQLKLYQILTFFTKLLAVGLVFQTILYIYPDTRGLQALMAQLISVVVNPLMADPFVPSGIDIITEGEIYVISQDCLGWKSIAAYIALIFASSKKFLDHKKALVVGVLLIFIANIVRIVTTIFLAHGGIVPFSVIHDVLWKWSLTGIVFVLWIIWLEGIVTEEKIKNTLERVGL